MQEQWRKRVETLRSASWSVLDSMALHGLLLQQAWNGLGLRKAVSAAWPRHVDDRRQRRRLRVDRDVTFREEGQEPRTAHVINVSRNGMYLETSTPLEEGREMTIHLHTIAQNRITGIHGKVVRSAPQGMAVKFI